MKRFHELTPEQQEQAIQYAADKLFKLMIEGVIMTGTQITKAQIREIAEGAADDAYYSEKIDTVIADIADGK